MGTFVNNIPEPKGRNHPYCQHIEVVASRGDLHYWQSHIEGIRNGKTSFDKNLDTLRAVAEPLTDDEFLLHLEYHARGANGNDFTREGGILDTTLEFKVVTSSTKRRRLCDCVSTGRSCTFGDD